MKYKNEARNIKTKEIKCMNKRTNLEVGKKPSSCNIIDRHQDGLASEVLS